MALATEDELDLGDPPARPDDPDDGDDDDGDGDRWITVATFWMPAQAHIARLRLESADIDCVVIDENLVATDWLLAPAVGGIKVQVREADAPAACDALERVSPETDVAIPSTAPSQHRCPTCGSDAIVRPWITRRVVWAALVALMISGLILLPLTLSLFVLYLILLRPYRCTVCRHEWTPAVSSSASRGFPLDAN